MSRPLLCAALLFWGGGLLAALSAQLDTAGPDGPSGECTSLCAILADAARGSEDSSAPRTVSDSQEPGDAPMIDPLGPNAACYVCHMTFVHEELSTAHQAEDVTCVTCHGLSAGHANDENIGATPPDVRYARCRIDAACAKCHPKHNAPARDVLARFFERRLRARRAPVCTDCHGRHRIAAAKGALPATGDDALPAAGEGPITGDEPGSGGERGS